MDRNNRPMIVPGV